MDFKSLMPFGRSTGLSRTGTESDPFTSLRRDMDRLFEDFTRGWGLSANLATSALLSPKVNVAETDKGLKVTADLPGVDQKDIEINLADGILTLKAEHKAEKEEKDEKRPLHVQCRSAESKFWNVTTNPPFLKRGKSRRQWRTKRFRRGSTLRFRRCVRR